MQNFGILCFLTSHLLIIATFLQVGFLYLRYVANPRTLWEWIKPYVRDSEVCPSERAICDWLILHQVPEKVINVSMLFLYVCTGDQPQSGGTWQNCDHGRICARRLLGAGMYGLYAIFMLPKQLDHLLCLSVWIARARLSSLLSPCTLSAVQYLTSQHHTVGYANVEVSRI